MAQGNPAYAAMVESLDDSVGRILKKLDDLKLADNTLVIFASDNGGLSFVANGAQSPTVNAPLREGKGTLYEGGLRVPLIVRWPGVTTAGAVVTEPVCAMDFYPTILEACGIKDDEHRDGLSFTPALKGQSLNRDTFYWHYPHYHNGQPGGAIRWKDWKLIEFYDTGRRELYDLKQDLGESRNLVESQKQLVDDLAEKLDDWRKEVGAKMMNPNPDYQPNPQGKDGQILLPSRRAEIHGTTLRFEPLPNKNTLGYWTRTEDWASWDLTVSKPGSFTVEILQGCGKGHDGSEVDVVVGTQSLKFTVEDTGGFQNFKPREIGEIKLEKPGRYLLELRPRKKAAGAIMDVRSITLKPIDK